MQSHAPAPLACAALLLPPHAFALPAPTPPSAQAPRSAAHGARPAPGAWSPSALPPFKWAAPTPRPRPPANATAPKVKSWVRYAKFEMKHSNVAGARTCYERALEALGDDANTVRVP